MSYETHASGEKYHGLHKLTAYRNSDGKLVDTNCGLAAAATGLHYKHLYKSTKLIELEEAFPPDILFGLCGSSRTLVCKILHAYKCHFHIVKGQKALKHSLNHKHPVLVMLSLPDHLAAGHWMVAYGYDEDHVHLSNYRSHKDRMAWSKFLEGWDATLPALIDMDNRGISIQ